MTGAAAIIIAASTASRLTDESTLIEVEFVSTFLMTLLSARFLPQGSHWRASAVRRGLDRAR
jgi:hypothetical protein